MKVEPNPIGILVSQLSHGGAERQTALLVEQLASRYGLRPWVYSMSPSLHPFGERIREAGCELLSWERAGSYELRRGLDIRRAVRRRGTRLLHAVHYEAASYGYLSLLGMRGVRLLPAIRSTVIRPRPVKAAIYRRLLRSSPRVIANSRSGADFIVERFGVDPSSLRVIPNGVDLGQCRPRRPAEEVRRELGIPPERKLIAYVGKESRHKDMPFLFRILRRVLAEHEAAMVLLMGQGLDDGRVRELSGDQSGRLRGLGARDDLFDVLAACHTLVLSSRTEGCPNTILEAMSLGVPPVATEVGDCGRIISRGRNGFLFPHGDDEEGARCLSRLLADDRLRAEMSRRGRETIRQRFSLEAMVDRTLAVYREVLGSLEVRSS